MISTMQCITENDPKWVPFPGLGVLAWRLGLELLPEAGQRPLLDHLWQSQRPHEVGEIVGQRMKLKPDGVGGAPPLMENRPTRWSCLSPSWINREKQDAPL